MIGLCVKSSSPPYVSLGGMRIDADDIFVSEIGEILFYCNAC
jgi:hypothetical protein